jgi:hypothetical protein
LDVEGHEESVLRGGQQALQGLRVRDWVIEHDSGYPSGVTDLLERQGYRLFWISKKFFLPALVEITTPVVRSDWEA